MFVSIENFTKSAIELDYELRQMRKEYGTIPPKDALCYLKQTNHTGNIKFILKEINKLDKEKRWYYKAFVISAVCRRAQTESVYENLKNLAIEGGYLEEFKKADKDKKIYNPHDCLFVFVYNSTVDLKKCIEDNKRCIAKFDSYRSFVDFSSLDLKNVADLYLGNIQRVCFSKTKNIPPYTDLSNCFQIEFGGCDLSQFEGVNFVYGAMVKFNGDYSFPDNFDVSRCKKINFENCDISNLNDVRVLEKGIFYKTVLPKAVYLYPKASVVFDECDFSTVNELGYTSDIINANAIKFIRCRNLPKVLDLSKCEHFSFKDTDLAGVAKIKFRPGRRIDLSGAYNFPEVMSFPPLDYLQDVCLSSCDLKGVKELHFSEKTSVEIRNSKNLPENLDFTNCYRVDLTGSDMTGVQNIVFGKDSTVLLREAINVPTCLDFSMCDEVYVDEASLLNVKSIKFASREQRDKVLKKIKFKGRVVFNNKISNIFNGLGFGGKED